MGCGTSSPQTKPAVVQPHDSAPPPKRQISDRDVKQQPEPKETEAPSERESPDGAGVETQPREPTPPPVTEPKKQSTPPASEPEEKKVVEEEKPKEEEANAKEQSPAVESEGAKDINQGDNKELTPEGETNQLATSGGDGNDEMGAKQSSDNATSDPLNEAVVKRFVDLETEINEILDSDVVSQCKTAEERLEKLTKDLQGSAEKVAQLKAKTAKEYSDVAKLKGANMHQFVIDNYQQQLSKEEEEYFSALNEEKMEERNHEVLEAQMKKAQGHVETLKKQREKLVSLQEEQENLLCDVFDGDYGSEREQKLELKVNVLMDKQRYVKTAHLRWSNAQFYLDQSLRQLHVAIQRWVDLRRYHPTQRELIYRMANEACKNLTAALQNTSGARNYLLPQVHAPYCTDEDLNRLAIAVHRLYYDMMHPQTHRAAYDLYVDFYRRACLFHQWIDHTLKENIVKDLAKTTRKLGKQRTKLMAERKRILLLRVEGKTEEEGEGEASDNDEEEDEEEVESEVKEVVSDEMGPAEADTVSQHEGSDDVVANGDEMETKEGSPGPSEVPSFKRVPLSELAPPPSNDQVYGDVDGLMKQHEEELAEFDRAKQRAKERTEQDLKEKLRQRRSRRRKVEQQAIQEQMLKKD